LESEGVGAAGGFGEGVGSGEGFAQEREVVVLLRFVGPAQERADDEGVLDVDEDADGGIDGGDFFDGEDGFEEGSGGATVGFGDLDAHEAELKELAEERGVEGLLFVHGADEGRDFVAGKVADGVAEEGFVGGELSECGHRGRV